jgi:hypothetical protein
MRNLSQTKRTKKKMKNHTHYQHLMEERNSKASIGRIMNLHCLLPVLIVSSSLSSRICIKQHYADALLAQRKTVSNGGAHPSRIACASWLPRAIGGRGSRRVPPCSSSKRSSRPCSSLPPSAGPRFGMRPRPEVVPRWGAGSRRAGAEAVEELQPWARAGDGAPPLPSWARMGSFPDCVLEEEEGGPLLDPPRRRPWVRLAADPGFALRRQIRAWGGRGCLPSSSDASPSPCSTVLAVEDGQHRDLHCGRGWTARCGPIRWEEDGGAGPGRAAGGMQHPQGCASWGHHCKMQ